MAPAAVPVPPAHASGRITDEILEVVATSANRYQSGAGLLTEAEMALLSLVIAPALTELLARRHADRAAVTPFAPAIPSNVIQLPVR